MKTGSICAEKLSASIIRGWLPEELRSIEVFVLDTIDSTNNYAKSLALKDAAQEALVLSEEQSAGRGRHGKSFFSPEGTGLYMSLLLPGSGAFCGAQLITVAAAVAVCRAIESTLGIMPDIKWVNDIYYNARKVCGILCETVRHPENGESSGVIIGVGVNCNTEIFPLQLRETAGSLGIAVDRNRLAAAICKELYGVMSSEREVIIDEYRQYSLMTGKRVSFERNGKTMQAVVEGIGWDGSLIVMSGCGERIYLNSGEVSVKGLGEWK